MDRSVYDRGIVNVGNAYRLKRAMKRAEQGEELTVLFLGGSITQDSAAIVHEKCYAYRTFKWWRQNFPKASIRYVNAGIGATDSRFAAARLSEDVLLKHPDVVYCEFSVNDENTALYKESFEGVIRGILTAPGEPALFLFNNVFYDDGRSAQEVHNEVAMYYDLPIVSIRDSIFEELLLGNLNRADITADNLHPNDYGHELVAGVITNLMDIIRERFLTEDEAVTPYVLPIKALTANRFFGAKRYRNDYEGIIANGFLKDESEQQGVRDVFKKGFFADQAGAELTFSVAAAAIYVQYRKTIAHPAGIAEVFVDGEPAGVLDANFEETWGDCLFMQQVYDGRSFEKHTVTIRLREVPEGMEKPFYLVAVLTRNA